MNDSLRLDRLISVDGHVLEPPRLWLHRVPAQDRERAPRPEYEDTAAEPPVMVDAVS